MDIGHLTHVISNAHVYDSHYDLATQLLNNVPDLPGGDLSNLGLHRGTLDHIISGVDLDETVKYLLEKVTENYHPLEVDEKPEVII
jgi:thymidylate synthase